MEKLVKSTDGFISRYINRKISIRITRAIVKYKVPLTPNQVSIISFVLGLISALLYVLGMPIPAAIMVQVSSIIDGVDGELARLLGLTSRVGAFLDAILDRFVDIAIIASLTYYVSTLGIIEAKLLVVISMLALSGDLLVSYIHARGEASLGVHPSRIGIIPNFSSRDVRLFIIFVGTLIGMYIETLIVVAILSYAYVISKFIDSLLNYKEVKFSAR